MSKQKSRKDGANVYAYVIKYHHRGQVADFILIHVYSTVRVWYVETQKNADYTAGGGVFKE